MGFGAANPITGKTSGVGDSQETLDAQEDLQTVPIADAESLHPSSNQVESTRHAESPPTEFATYLSLFSNRPIMIILLRIAISGVAYCLVDVFPPLYLARNFGLEFTQIDSVCWRL
jgi:hypothetical protein